MINFDTKYDFNLLAWLALAAFGGFALIVQPLAVLGTTLAAALFLAAIVRPDWIVNLLILTLPLQGTLVLTYRANIKVSELLGCVLIVALVFRLLIWREEVVGDPRVTIPLFCFLAVVLLSTLNTPRLRGSMVLNQYMELGVGRDSPDARSYITALWGVYCALLLLSVPAVLRDSAKLFRAFRALLWSGACTAIFGIFQWIYLLRTDELYQLPGSVYHLDVVHSTADGFPRSPSTFTEPSLFASYLILLLPITLAVAAGAYPRIMYRRTAYTFFVLEVLALLLSFSVSGYVLFLIGISFFLYLAAAAKPQRKRGRIIGRIIACSIGFLLGVAVLQSVGVYPSDVGEFVIQRLIGQADSAQQRLGLAQIGWEMARDHFLTGVGIGNYPFMAMSYGAKHSVVLMQFIFPTPSNLFILFAAEIGIPGLLLFGWLVTGVYRFLTAVARIIPAEFRLLHFGVCASIAGALLTFAFLDNLFVNYLWIILGMSVALYRVSTAEMARSGIDNHVTV